MNTTPDKTLRPAFFLHSATRFDHHCLMLASAAAPGTWEHHVSDAPILARGTRFALCRDRLLVAMISLCESASTKAAVATCQILEWHVRADLDATDRQHAHFILARAFALSRNHRTLIEHIRPRNSSIPARAYLQQVLEGGIEDRCILWRACAGASFAVPSSDDGKSDALIEVSWRLDR